MVSADSHGISRAPCYSGFSSSYWRFRLQDFYLLWCSFQLLRLVPLVSLLLSHYPIKLALWFRLLPFRSPLLGESLLISFPRATKMFQFARLAHACLWIQQAVLGVAPFGYLRLDACFQLPGVFRRSPRPSSPLCAEGFTVSCL